LTPADVRLNIDSGNIESEGRAYETLLYALGPMLFDSLGVLVFAVLLVAGAGIVPATIAGTVVALAVVGYELARGKKVAALQWISLASVLLTAAATLFTGDPRFVMAKPTIVYLIVGSGDAASRLAQSLYHARTTRAGRRCHGPVRHDLGGADVHKRGPQPRRRGLLHRLVAAVHRDIPAGVEIRPVRGPHRGGAFYRAGAAAPPRGRRICSHIMPRPNRLSRRRARKPCAARAPRVRFHPRRSAR
jgi:hypothetical protein